MKSKPKTEQQFLNGWKDIANHLRKGVRTVQRYERQMGLPVRRPSGQVRGSVIATLAEIDAWVEAGPLREALPLSKPDLVLQHSTVDVIRKSISDMHRLRAEMQTLRNDVSACLGRLHERLTSLEGDLDEERWPETDPRKGGSGVLH